LWTRAGRDESTVVDTLNVWHEHLPEFDHESIGAKYKAVKHVPFSDRETEVWGAFSLRFGVSGAQIALFSVRPCGTSDRLIS